MSRDGTLPIEGADWPLFGWEDDIRPALSRAVAAGRDCVLATLFRLEGSSPRGPGAQMLFDGTTASGYFTGDCIEADVARHAAEVLADGTAKHLVYGVGGPFIDIRLRCGGTLHIFVERIPHDCPAVAALLESWRARQSVIWRSDGYVREVLPAGDAAMITEESDPLRVTRRYDPARRLVVSGGDPAALAIAQLGMSARFEVILVRPDGPSGEPPVPGLRYLRSRPVNALEELGVDRWTAFVGASHEDEPDLPACVHALRHDAAYVGLIGAKARAVGRKSAMAGMGAREDELERVHVPAGIGTLGKAPWEVAVAVMAQVMQAMNSTAARE